MADAVRDRLQATLGDSYTLDHELSGGGMSRVFAAEDSYLGRRRAWIASVGFFVACALAYFVLPLGAPFGEVLVGTAVFPHDSVLNAGILEWGYHSLWNGAQQLFEWNAGYPLENSLATTENLIGWQLFYSPVRALGAGVVATYNVLLIGAFVTSAVGATLLARRLGADGWGSCAAGFVFAFAPFHLAHAMHLQTMAVCWSPFAVFFLDRLLQGPRWGDGAGLVLALTVSILSGMYIGVFLAAVLAMYALLSWALGRCQFRWQSAVALAGAGAVALLAAAPVLTHYVRFNAQHGFHHSVAELTRFSMEVIALAKVPTWLASWSGTGLSRDARESASFPGLVVLALLGCFVLWHPRRATGARRRVGALLGTLVMIAVLFAFGPVLKLRGDYPSRIAEWVPLPGRLFAIVSAIRWPMRAMLYAYLFGAILAGLGLTLLLARLRAPWRRAVAVLVLALLALEYRPAAWYSNRSRRLGAPLELSRAYSYLAREADRGAVVELPLGDSTGYRTPMRTWYVYASAGHLRRVVALHGSVRPPVLDTLEASASRLPDARAIRTLAAHGVTRLVVHRDLMPPPVAERLVEALRRQAYDVLYDGRDAIVFALRAVR